MKGICGTISSLLSPCSPPPNLNLHTYIYLFLYISLNNYLSPLTNSLATLYYQLQRRMGGIARNHEREVRGVVVGEELPSLPNPIPQMAGFTITYSSSLEFYKNTMIPLEST